MGSLGLAAFCCYVLGMWPFEPGPIVDRDTAQRHAENFTWLVKCFSDDGAVDQTVLVLPAPGFFPSDGERGHAKALHIFGQVKQYCAMEDWKVELVADDDPVALPRSQAS